VRPWHRDALVLAGLLAIAAAAFSLNVTLGLFVVGVELIATAVALSVVLAPPEKEQNDGPR